MNVISNYFKKIALKKAENRRSFERIMKRFDSKKYVRDIFSQGELCIIHDIKCMYLYSQMDEDTFLRLDTNDIVILNQEKVFYDNQNTDKNEKK